MRPNKPSRFAGLDWGPFTMVVLLFFSAVVAAVLGFATVVLLAGGVHAMVKFARSNLTVALTGGCAFYLALFILSMLALERILGRFTQIK